MFDHNELTYFKLIQLVKNHECLWNPKHKLYQLRDAKEEAYRKIAIESGIPNVTVSEVKRKCRNLRTQYFRQKKKLEKLKAKGCAPIPTLYWYNHANNHCPFSLHDSGSEAETDNETEKISTSSLHYIDINTVNFSTSSVHCTDNNNENISTSSVPCIDIKTETTCSIASSEVEDIDEHFMEYNGVTSNIEFVDTNTSLPTANEVKPTTEFLETHTSSSTSIDLPTESIEDESESFAGVVKNMLTTLPPMANALCRKEIYDILHKYQMEYVYNQNNLQ